MTRGSQAACLVLALSLAACGGSKDSPTSPSVSASASTPPAPTLTQTRAETVANAVHLAIFQAILKLNGIPDRPPPPAGSSARPQAVIDLPPIHDEEACPGGGLSSLDGTARVTEHDDGAFDLRMDMRFGFADCVWPGVILHGDPHLTLAMVMSGTAEAVTRTTLQIQDSVAFTVEAIRGRVQYNCTHVMDLSKKAPEISGSIVWEYPVGTRVTGPGCSDSAPEPENARTYFW